MRKFTDKSAKGTVMNVQRTSRGFTLIELVVVIAILAILAAFALPRFAQLSEEAHRSSVKAISGALSASVALVKAQWVTNGLTGIADDVQGFGNNDIDVNADGWPVSVDGANDPTAITADRCVDLWEALLQSNAPSVATSGDVDYLTSATAPECTFTYTLDGQDGTANAKEIVYNADTGEVSTNVN
ncbi:MAG: prepilin-type N-terminal cleavage/methylation domain-containing protein [Marinobacter sp.]|uniref:prepilin-type N-terminal cleavage/methylation domain-containing protein n=1 Tax=Marinobacter sp. TaxID=50741 RepID=UPI00396E411F